MTDLQAVEAGTAALRNADAEPKAIGRLEAMAARMRPPQLGAAPEDWARALLDQA